MDDLVAGDLGLEVGDLGLARLALLVDVALLPSGGYGVRSWDARETYPRTG